VNQETANKLVTLAVLKKIVDRLDREVRGAVAMDPGDRKAAYASEKRIGAVTMSDPKPAFKVTDGAAFRAWVKEHRPDEIVTTEAVRSSFERAILEVGCDAATGEAIPGVELVDGTPYVIVKAETGAESAIRHELATNGLSFAAVLDSFDPKAIES
jgi:hypothetical protein